MNPQDCDVQQDELWAHSPSGKLLQERGSPRRTADSWDKREYCKTAEAFVFMTKSKTLGSLLCDVVSQREQSNLKIS